MAKPKASAKGFLVQIWGRLKDEIIGEVSPENALCEYDCSKEQCMQGEWSNCDRRLSHASGELMPDKRAGHESC